MRGRVARWVLLAAVPLALFLLFRFLPLLHWIAMGADRARAAGFEGALLGALAIVVSTLLLAPVIPLVIAAGWVWGMAGLLVSLPAAAISAAIAFSVSRALGQSAVARALRTHPRMSAVVELAERGGTFTVVLLRISPLVPFTPGNASLGLTRITLLQLVAGTLLGQAPGALLYTFAGSLVPDAAALERGEILQGGWLWVLVALGIGSSILVAGAAVRRLQRTGRAAATPP